MPVSMIFQCVQGKLQVIIKTDAVAECNEYLLN